MEQFKEFLSIVQEYPRGAVLFTVLAFALIFRGTPAADAVTALFSRGFLPWWQSRLKRAEERDKMRIEAERARNELELESRRAESAILRQAADLLNHPDLLPGRGLAARVTGQHKTIDRDDSRVGDDGKGQE